MATSPQDHILVPAQSPPAVGGRVVEAASSMKASLKDPLLRRLEIYNSVGQGWQLMES